MRIGKIYQLMFLVFVVFGVFYPALFGGINSVDDFRMFGDLERISRIPFWQLFLPSSGYYYRPLLMASFVVDFRLWGAEPSFYHLVNIVLHAANACLVYGIVANCLARSERGRSHGYWPMLAALLFAVNPIVTESVNWISGRTDLMGAFFVLLSTLAIIWGGAHGKKRYVVYALMAAICAIMSKEIMVFFVPVGCYLLARFAPDGDSAWRKHTVALFGGPFLAAGVIYFIWRIALYGVDSGLSRLVNRYGYDLFDTVRVFFKVLGFYVKKIFLPLPLNFAIFSASDLYVWVGVLVSVLFFLLMRQKKAGFVLIASGLFLTLPGELVALTNIAWTPLAERYVYLATVFMTAGCVICLRDRVVPGRQSVVLCGCVLLLWPMTMATVERNLVWQDNEKLYADTKLKSPNFTVAYNEEAVALIEGGKLDEAEKIIAAGKKLSSESPLLHINQARIDLLREKFDLARGEILSICADKNTCDLEALKLLARIDEVKRLKGLKVNIGDLTDTYGVLSRRSSDPFFSYKYAQLLYLAGHETESLQIFEKVVKWADDTDFFKPAAVKYVARIRKELAK